VIALAGGMCGIAQKAAAPDADHLPTRWRDIRPVYRRWLAKVEKECAITIAASCWIPTTCPQSRPGLHNFMQAADRRPANLSLIGGRTVEQKPPIFYRPAITAKSVRIFG